MMSYLMWYIKVLSPDRLVFWIGLSFCVQVLVEVQAEKSTLYGTDSYYIEWNV